MSRSIIFAFFAVGLIASPGCKKDPPPTTAPQPTAAAPQEQVAADATTECRDWSKLDASTLPALPQSEYAATFDHAWRTILERHYDSTIGCTDWPSLRTEYGAKIAAAKDQAEAYGLMNEMLGKLGQSHMAIIPPGKEAKGEPRSGTVQHAGMVPIRAKVLGDAVVVTSASVYGFKTKIPPGAALTKVGDHEVAPMFSKMRESHPRAIEADLLIGRTVGAWLSCPVGEKQQVTFVPPGKDAPKTKSIGCKDPKVERVSMGNIQNFPSEFEARVIKGTKTGYIRFNIWMMPLLAKIETGIADLRKKGIDSLVIDLRGNPGGVGMMAVPVARQLLAEEATLGVMTMRETTQNFKVTPQGEPFAGPVALLVDEGTGSTSEIFAQAMQDLKRVKIVGATPSQGAVLASFIEKLPGGATLQFVVADYKSPNGTLVEGKGVTPDVLVEEGPEDYAQGRDPVLEAAVAAVSPKG